MVSEDSQTTSISDGSTAIPLRADHSCWAPILGITDWREDAEQWEKDWDKNIYSLVAVGSVHVFEIMSVFWVADIAETERQHAIEERKHLSRMQGLSANWLEEVQQLMGGLFETMWHILGDARRRRYILNALIFACELGDWEQDARPLCPEITVSNLCADEGQGMLSLLSAYLDASKSTGAMETFFLPNGWWDELLGDLPQPVSEKEFFVYESLTVFRNEFIGKFVFGWLKWFMHDIADMDGDVREVVQLLQNGPAGATADVHGARIRPQDSTPALCENCLRTPEELGSGARLLVCAACKREFYVAVAYCSKECQRAHWQRHKPLCGKNASAKSA